MLAAPADFDADGKGKASKKTDPFAQGNTNFTYALLSPRAFSRALISLFDSMLTFVNITLPPQIQKGLQTLQRLTKISLLTLNS